MGLLKGEAELSLLRADPNSRRGWRSRYYGQKEPALSVRTVANQAQACFWTFFGFDGDLVTLSNGDLDLQLGPRSISLALIKLSTPDGLKKVLASLD
jgi:hypothetical protein